LLVVVGLGNPGASYRNTRHNAGYMLVDGIASGEYICDAIMHQGGSKVLNRLFAGRNLFHKSSGPYVRIEGELNGKRFMLVKPTTYMNESGKAVSWLFKKGIVRDLSDVIVVVDDINLETGRIRLREKGSDGGQKGLRSIISHLGANEFCRLRLGVGPKPDGEDLKRYVLTSFRPDERVVMERSLSDAASVVEAWIEGGYESSQREVSRLSNG